MNASSERDTTRLFWLRIAALVLVVAGLGLPINDLFRYALLVLAAVSIFTGEVSKRLGLWCVAVGAVALMMAGQWLWPAPRLDEGYNVFVVPDGRTGALERTLPADAFHQMLSVFDAAYPPERRCDLSSSQCWRAGGFPDGGVAFSTDSIYSGADYSRRVTGIDFADPVWLRLGFINEAKYNWSAASDIQRTKRNPWWSVLHRWRLAMPFFVVYRFPAAFVGSELCWQGLALWEDADGRFTATRHADFACREIVGGDVGRQIFGVSIGSALAMTLKPSAAVRFRDGLETGMSLLSAAAVLWLLVRWQRKRLAFPLTLMGLALLVVLLTDSAFIGGVRPFDGGDDGLVYESTARHIVQHAINGEIAQALEGGEKVYFYGGPGLRYVRAAEHFIFGDSFLGYLSLILALPLIVFAAFRRFFEARTALALALVFTAVPIGAVFGTTFYQYVKWAGRGFADPAAATVFLMAFVMLVGPTAAGPGRRFAPAFTAGLLFAMALWLRPNLAPGAGVLLAGAGVAALWQTQFWRIAGLCLGFLPVLGMALHNWVFGHVFVLFSANASIPEAIPMPPKDYVAAAGELLRMDLGGDHLRRGALQIARWLAGPSESFPMAPLHAVAVVVLVRVAFFGRRFDPWLRLTAGAMLAQHPVALFYLSAGRYYYLPWLLTLLVCAVWVRTEGLVLFRASYPGASETLARHPLRARLAGVLDGWAMLTAIDGAEPARSSSR